MHRFLCFVSSVMVASCANTQDSGSILNLHLAESNDAAMLNGLDESKLSSERFLGALEKRAPATEQAMGHHMSVINAQIHELVGIGLSFRQQLRSRNREQQLLGISPDAAQLDVDTL